jgi:hypothetical protein
MPSEDVHLLTFLGCFFAATLIAAWLAWRSGRRARANHQRLADLLNLALERPQRKFLDFFPPIVATGKFRGRAAELRGYSIRNGGESWCSFSVEAHVRREPTFQLVRPGFAARLKMTTQAGEKRSYSDDPAFDRCWAIWANEPDFIRGILSVDLRNKIHALVEQSDGKPQYPSFMLGGNFVEYKEAGSFASERRCARFVKAADVVIELAEAVENFRIQPRRT